jgi:hypothetical protein
MKWKRDREERRRSAGKERAQTNVAMPIKTNPQKKIKLVCLFQKEIQLELKEESVLQQMKRTM